jgi:trehalose-6-phosphate synthase
LRARYAPDGAIFGLGVDRVDYSKGLEEKLKTLDLLFESYPQLRERFTYVQIAVPSRTGIDAYDWLNEKLERAVWSVNDRHGTETWQPVHLLKESLPLDRLALYYRAADVCLVNSLQDGMNLVAKEFVAAQVDDPAGVLVLSKFAGAAEELDGAVEVNPFDPEAAAARSGSAAHARAGAGRAHARSCVGSLRSIYDWMAEIFEVWSAVASGEAGAAVGGRLLAARAVTPAQLIRRKRDGARTGGARDHGVPRPAIAGGRRRGVPDVGVPHGRLLSRH